LFQLSQKKEILIGCLLAVSSVANITFPEGQVAFFSCKAQVM